MAGIFEAKGRPRFNPLIAHVADAVQSGAGQVADPVAVAHRGDDGQRAGPEGLGQGAGAVIEDGDSLGLHGVGDVGDQGVEAGPALGLEDGGDRGRIPGVGGEAIDRLGRQDQEAAGRQGLGRLGVGGSGKVRAYSRRA